jgi:prolipoprotein diacylglyceryltransferase
MTEDGSKQKTTEASVKLALRSRTRLLVCFLTLPLYVIAVWVLLSNSREVGALMWIYIALYSVFAIDMVRRRCPSCGEQFFVKSILLNLFTTRCVHCDEGG